MRTRKSNRTFIQEIIRRSWFIGTIMLAVLAVVSPARALSLTDAVTGSRYLGGMAVVVQGDDGSNGREAVTFRNFTPDVRLAAGIYSDESSPASRPESVNPEAAAGVMNFILFSMKPKISSTADASPWEKFQDVGLIGSFNFAVGHSFDLGGTLASTFDAKSESGSRGRTPDARRTPPRDSFNVFDASGKKADLLSSAAIFSYDPLTNLTTLFRTYSRLEKSDTRGGGGRGGWLGKKSAEVLAGIASTADLIGLGGKYDNRETGGFTFGVGVIPNPEPATFALLAGGFGLLGFAAWRRKRKRDLRDPPGRPV